MRNGWLAMLIVGGLWAVGLAQPGPVSAQEPSRPALALPSVAGRDLFQFYCATCHGDGKQEGGLSLVSYAGVMKGVVLSICPEATVVDLSHDLPAHDIPFAAWELAAIYKYFPAGTIFLIVVDPGVGTARRGLAAEAGDWKFVAPDNGVLSGVFQEIAPKKVVELTERVYLPPRHEATASDLLSALDGWTATSPHIRQAAREIARLCQSLPAAGATAPLDERAFRRAVLAGYPDRVARRREAGSPRVKLSSGAGASLSRDSGVLDAEFLVALDVRGSAQADSTIPIASAIESDWLHVFTIRGGKVAAFKELNNSHVNSSDWRPSPSLNFLRML